MLANLAHSPSSELARKRLLFPFGHLLLHCLAQLCVSAGMDFRKLIGFSQQAFPCRLQRPFVLLGALGNLL